MAHAHTFEAIMFQSNIASAESRVLTNYHLGFKKMEFAKSHMVGKGWSEGVGLGRHGQV